MTKKLDKLDLKGLSLLSLAIPILIEQVLRLFMGTVNTFMLSRISDEASASVGVANQIINVVIMAGSMLALGVSVIVNQKLGAKEEEEAAIITMNSISISALIGLLFGLILSIFAPGLISLMGLRGDLAIHGRSYLSIVGISCFFQFISLNIATQFRSRGRAEISTLVIVFNNLVNLIGSYLVIQDKLPIKGVSGIGYVRLISETLGLLLIAILFYREKWNLSIKDLVNIRWKYFKSIVSIGFMTGMEGISYTTVQLITTRYLTVFSSIILSAKVYTQTINGYNYLIGLSIGQAAQIISGYLIGRGEEEKAYRFIRKTWLYVSISNILVSLIFFVFSSQLLGLFTASEEIKLIAKTLFFIDIIINIGRALSHSFNYGLRSAGYVFWPMIFASASIWLINGGLGYILTISFGIGIVGLWIAQALDEWLRGLFAMRLWLKKSWFYKELI